MTARFQMNRRKSPIRNKLEYIRLGGLHPCKWMRYDATVTLAFALMWNFNLQARMRHPCREHTPTVECRAREGHLPFCWRRLLHVSFGSLSILGSPRSRLKFFAATRGTSHPGAKTVRVVRATVKLGF